jgi:hypothetical protein
MNTIYRYILILIACASLLLGIQIPNFVDQYEKRLDAHLIEAENNLRGYQEIADKFYGGSLAELIDKHEQSPDGVFREEAKPIKNIFDRYQHFHNEKLSLEFGLTSKVAYILAKGDRQLINETYSNYSFTVPLNASAILAGFSVMVFIVLSIELLRIAALKVFSARKHPAKLIR